MVEREVQRPDLCYIVPAGLDTEAMLLSCHTVQEGENVHRPAQLRATEANCKYQGPVCGHQRPSSYVAKPATGATTVYKCGEKDKQDRLSVVKGDGTGDAREERNSLS